MFRNAKLVTIVMILGLFVLAGCGLPAQPTIAPTQIQPDAVYTQAAQTVVAQLTQAAEGQPTVPPTPLPTNTTAPTNPPVATATTAPTQVVPTATLPPAPQATATAVPTQVPPTPTTKPTATAVPIPCNRAQFVKDVNYTDNTQVAAGSKFTKTWRIKNTGTCSWDSSYSLVFTGGDKMGATTYVDWTFGTVDPGEIVDVSVNFTVPTALRTYTSNWKIEDEAGHQFGVTGQNGELALFVRIVAFQPEELHYDFLTQAKKAEWHNATKKLTWGDKNNDDDGVATYGLNIKLENGLTYEQVLGTYPQRIQNGIIYGIFPAYKVKANDHFVSEIGFKDGCGDATAIFRLKYFDGANTVLLKEWTERCNDDLRDVDVVLRSLKGLEVQFILEVSTDGDFKGDKTVWINPRIVVPAD